MRYTAASTSRVQLIIQNSLKHKGKGQSEGEGTNVGTLGRSRPHVTSVAFVLKQAHLQCTGVTQPAEEMAWSARRHEEAQVSILPLLAEVCQALERDAKCAELSVYGIVVLAHQAHHEI